MPKQLVDFINDNANIKYEYIGYLPDVYADESCLVSQNAGGWRDEWRAFALNAMDDPFFVDITQGDIGFPVYFSWHGAGKWTPIKVADTLAHFGQVLKTILLYRNK